MTKNSNFDTKIPNVAYLFLRYLKKFALRENSLCLQQSDRFLSCKFSENEAVLDGSFDYAK